MKITGQQRNNLILNENILGANGTYVLIVPVDSLKTLFVTSNADQAGTCLIEGSPTGVSGANDWVTIASRTITANTPDFYSTNAYLPYVRITYTNGITAQTKFLLNVDGFPI